MKKQDRGPAAPGVQDTISAVECSQRLLRWLTENVYRTPIDDFGMALGAVWLSFCFDHEINPFSELHHIIETFPLRQALGTVVPRWATAGSASASETPAADSEKEGA